MDWLLVGQGLRKRESERHEEEDLSLPFEDRAIRWLSENQEEVSHQQLKSASTLILHFPAFRMWRNKFLFFKQREREQEQLTVP